MSYALSLQRFFQSLTLRRVLSWLDANMLLLLAGFLLAFIPLYPKIPSWSPIEQYIVRVRMEDFVIFFALLVWVVQFLRKKIVWKSSILWWILAYVVVAGLSTLCAMFITKTIPLQPLHVGKTLLHNFRYIEYFSLFAIFFSAIKTRKDVAKLLVIFAFAVVGMSIYGFGQKYFYWPVYSTMNREFSKGMRLVLTPHARVQSTFAGHYDMAAYLVLALPILLALAYQTKKPVLSYALHGAYWLGTWLIIVSASRTSFVAYLIAILLVVGITSMQKANLKERLKFAVTRGFTLVFISSILFLIFGADLADRLGQVINSNPQAHDTFHGLNKQRKDFWDKYVNGKTLTLPQQEVPTNAITTDEAIALGVLTPTDERPRPADVYVVVPDIQQVATTAADGTQSFIEVNKGPRTYSDNALKYGLSLAIRLDTLWPNAIKGFMSNPLLGKGYATLNKESVTHFTEAESTDNNFLRTLGETGALGFVTFYGAIVMVLIAAVKMIKRQDSLGRALGIGMLSATIGLLLNAAYIDVFASSKVAETFWALAGIFYAYVSLVKKQKFQE